MENDKSNSAASIRTTGSDTRQPAPASGPQRFSKQDFRLALSALLDEAQQAGKPLLELRAADLHARVGGYPGRGHSMPTCCSAMREAMHPADTVLAEPAKGQGPGLHIRYQLPR